LSGRCGIERLDIFRFIYTVIGQDFRHRQGEVVLE
jgi:hypothetical protein